MSSETRDDIGRKTQYLWRLTEFKSTFIYGFVCCWCWNCTGSLEAVKWLRKTSVAQRPNNQYFKQFYQVQKPSCSSLLIFSSSNIYYSFSLQGFVSLCLCLSSFYFPALFPPHLCLNTSKYQLYLPSILRVETSTFCTHIILL